MGSTTRVKDYHDLVFEEINKGEFINTKNRFAKEINSKINLDILYTFINMNDRVLVIYKNGEVSSNCLINVEKYID